MDLDRIRRDYGVGSLRRAELPSDPLTLFRSWFDAALDAELPEPNAMTLATVGTDGRPSQRVLLLKSFDEDGFVFATNYRSRKGRELDASPAASLCLFWQPLERQVRIEGEAERAPAAVSDRIFNARPRSSRIGAWASEQSEPLADRAAIESRVEELTERFAEGEVPRPEHWGAFRLRPRAIEFWQGGANRLHDRFVYRRVDDTRMVDRPIESLTMSQRVKPSHADVVAALPLRRATTRGWAELAAGDLATFLADHAVCEQAAAVSALSLVAIYPDDEELVERMTALAMEEVSHLRRVAHLLRRRGHSPAKRRTNPYVVGLHDFVSKHGEPWRKIDRLLVGALIEARSCERFTCLYEVVSDRDPEVAALFEDLGPAEMRHWELFWRLAERGVDPVAFAERWEAWLAHEDALAAQGGRGPTVHG